MPDVVKNGLIHREEESGGKPKPKKAPETPKEGKEPEKKEKSE